MKIVVLDSYTLNPGDQNWEPLQSLGNFTEYDRTAPAQILERAQEAEIVLVNKVILNRETISQLPKLRYIGVLATGYNNIDIEAAKERGIIVTNVRAYGPTSVAQQSFALLLALVNRAELHSDSVHNGEWTNAPDWCYWKTPLVELAGKTMGLIGFGDIGSQVAQIAQAFGMNVIVYRKNPSRTQDDSVKLVSLETIFTESDVVSLHCPLTDETKEIINATHLAMMKPTAYLLNTGRGPLINEQELADALKRGVIATIRYFQLQTAS
jgi:glycerate dehydrogenase